MIAEEPSPAAATAEGVSAAANSSHSSGKGSPPQQAPPTKQSQNGNSSLPGAALPPALQQQTRVSPAIMAAMAHAHHAILQQSQPAGAAIAGAAGASRPTPQPPQLKSQPQLPRLMLQLPSTAGAGGPHTQQHISGEHTWLHIGKLAQSMSDVKRAIKAYEMAFKCNPASMAVLTHLGPLLLQCGYYKQAIEVFAKLLSGSPPQLDWLSAIGYCWLVVGEFSKAYSAFQAALKLPNSGKDALLWFRIGLFYDCQESNESAMDAFLTSLKIYEEWQQSMVKSGRSAPSTQPPPFIRDLYYRVGILYRLRREYKTAIECFEYLLVVPPLQKSKVDVILQIALARDQEGLLDAVKALLEPLVLPPMGSPVMAWHAKTARHQLAWTQCREGSPHLAASMLQRCHEDDPGDAIVAFHLARALQDMNEHGAAFEAFQKAIFLENRNVAIWNGVGILYHVVGQHRDALDAYTKACQLDANQAEVWNNMAVLYEQCNGRTGDTYEAYSRSAQLNTHRNPHIAPRIDAQGNWLPPATEHGAPQLCQLDPRNFQPRPLCLASPAEPKPIPYLASIVASATSPPPTLVMGSAPASVAVRPAPHLVHKAAKELKTAVAEVEKSASGSTASDTATGDQPQ